MKLISLDFSNQIPEEIPTESFQRNGWIAPNGIFYGFEGARHEKAACYLAIFKCGANENSIRKGKYFNQGWESWLIERNWVCVKSLAWLGSSKPATFSRRNWTCPQKETIFEYCQDFGHDYEELFCGENS